MSQLPLNPSFEHLRKEAKVLLKDYHASDADALETIRQIHPRLGGQSNEIIRQANLPLGEMQFVIARRYGFSTWTEMKAYVEEQQRIDWNHPTTEQLKDRFIRAVNHGDSDEVRRLLKHDSLREHINDRWFSGAPALVQATANGLSPNWVVVALLDYGADIEATADWWTGSSTALRCAAWRFHYHAASARHLIQRGAKVDACSAAGLGMLDTPRKLVAADPAAAYAAQADGTTPLHFARSIEVADFLLEHGADINARDKEHCGTPAQWAMVGVHREQADDCHLAPHLIERGAEADIFLLCAVGDIERVKAMLAENPSLVHQDFDHRDFGLQAPGGHVYGWTKIGWGGPGCNALAVAFRYNHADLFRLLLEAGAQLRVSDWMGLGAHGRPKMADYLHILLECGIDLNSPVSDAEDRMTPLHLEAKEEGLQTREHLIDGVASHLAILLRHGADLHMKDARGRTALHHVAGNPYGRDGIRVLVEQGADVNARDSENRTPLDYAMAKGWKENVGVLKELGAS